MNMIYTAFFAGFCASCTITYFASIITACWSHSASGVCFHVKSSLPVLSKCTQTVLTDEILSLLKWMKNKSLVKKNCISHWHAANTQLSTHMGIGLVCVCVLEKAAAAVITALSGNTTTVHKVHLMCLHYHTLLLFPSNLTPWSRKSLWISCFFSFVITASEWIEIRKWIIVTVTCVAVKSGIRENVWLMGEAALYHKKRFGRVPPQGGSILLWRKFLWFL